MAMKLTKEALVKTRESLGLTQQAMSDRLGLSLRAYQALEQGESKYRPIHRLAIERIALAIAVETRSPAVAPSPVRNEALEFARMVAE